MHITMCMYMVTPIKGCIMVYTMYHGIHYHYYYMYSLTLLTTTCACIHIRNTTSACTGTWSAGTRVHGNTSLRSSAGYRVTYMVSWYHGIHHVPWYPLPLLLHVLITTTYYYSLITTCACIHIRNTTSACRCHEPMERGHYGVPRVHPEGPKERRHHGTTRGVLLLPTIY
jgi:hypothetical protein